MPLRYRLVDAFAEGPRRGNPAAVVELADWLPDAALQGIAARLAQPTTAFLRRDPESGGFALRWFTPTMEEAFCGHATLATAALVLRDDACDSVTFATAAGRLTVTRVDADGPLEFDVAARNPAPVAAPHPALLPALGVAAPAALLAARDYVVVLDSPAVVRAVRPDIPALAQLDRPAVIVTAPGEDGFDCVSRFFAPAHGIPEDHATGAAHAQLAPYWTARLGRPVLRALQASPRGGVFRCTLRPDGRVALAGRCVLGEGGEIEP